MSTLFIRGDDIVTISEILQKVDSERKIESRFPVRVIFCQSLNGYLDLTSRLRGACDCCWNIANFCSDKFTDRYPRFRNLYTKVEENVDKHILLLSVGEYLRLSTKVEVHGGEAAQFYELWKLMESAHSKTRIFIPIFAAKEYFFRAVGEVDERQKSFLWELAGDDNRNYKLTVYSDRFLEVMPSSQVVQGVKSWLLEWENYYKAERSMVITSHTKNCEMTFGKVSIDIIENPYKFLCSKDNSIEAVKQELSPDNFWVELMVKTSKTNDIRKALLEGLNLKAFDSISIISRWDYLEPIEQWYLWLWYQLYGSDEYISAIMKKMLAEDLERVPFHIYNDIIYYIDSHPEWIMQRQRFLKSLRAETPTIEFLKALDEKEPKVAMGLLTGKTMKEKAFIIRTVCRWLREKEYEDGIVEQISEALEKIYPEFVAYLRTCNDKYGNYTDYFKWYKKKKIINRSVSEPMAAADVNYLDTRSYLMSEYNEKDCISYWIDGLGIEWHSLVCDILNRKRTGLFTYTKSMAKCVVPSETEFNKQWMLNNYDYIKRDRLDIISHKGMPDDKDYFLAIANQIYVITELIEEAIEQLKDHEYVIITGDHGSSRLAALAFHEKDGVYVPKGAQSMCLGRFCLLKDKPKENEYLPECAEYCIVEDEKYLVFKNYDHFKQPGNAAGGNADGKAIAGEVHGGLTPEESIVPVIVLKKELQETPLKYSLKTKKMQHTGGKASVSIEFTLPIKRLSINTNLGKCHCVAENNRNWILHFEHLVNGEIEIEVIADNKVIAPKATLPVESRGLKEGNMGGLP